MKFLTMLLAIGSMNLMAGDWSHQTELSLNQFTGNSNQLNINGNHKSTTVFGDAWNFSGFGGYNYGEAKVNGDDAINTRNWNVGLRVGKNFTPVLEGYYTAVFSRDEFLALDSKLDNEIGAIYNFIKPKKSGDYNFGSHFFNVKLAYLFSMENFLDGRGLDALGAALPENRNNLVVGLAYGTPVTESLAFLANVDWIRTLGEDDRNLVNAFAGFKSQLSKHFALKFGYTLGYNDNAPQGVVSTDGQYTVTVMANY